jgi:hypothetical protein
MTITKLTSVHAADPMMEATAQVASANSAHAHRTTILTIARIGHLDVATQGAILKMIDTMI